MRRRIDPEDYERTASPFGIAEAMAREIMWENDEIQPRANPEARWQRMREWVQRHLSCDAASPAAT